MKGYCVDVRGFSLDKKELVKKAISKLTGLSYRHNEAAELKADKVTNVGSVRGTILSGVVFGYGELTRQQKPYGISFNDLMLEAGFNYEERGVESFGEIDVFKGVQNHNKQNPTTNHPRAI